MNFAILASIIVFCIWLAYEIKKHNKKQKKGTAAFWEKEMKADATRKQPLDDLNYIVLPEEILNLFVEEIPAPIKESAKFIQHAATAKIVNLGYITNTDLKLRYGAANLEILSEYDQNFTLLARHLQTIGEYFYEQKDYANTKLFLEYAVSIQSDLMGTYRTLASVYNEEGNTAGLDYLISNASLLPGLTKGPILKYLYDLRPEGTNEQESILDILD